MALTRIKTGGLIDNSVTDAKVADAITITGAQTGITQVGTLTAGVWNGTKVASAYLDDDTAHLSGTQTFSGAKTFTANPIIQSDSGTLNFYNASGAQRAFLQLSSTGLIIDTDSFIEFKPNNTRALYIDSSLNSTFAGNLTVNGTGSDVITGDYLYLDAHNNTAAKNLVFRQLDDTWLGQIEFHPTNKGWITTRVNQPLAFGVNNSEKVIIDTEGNVGIGSGSNTNARIVRGFSNNKGLVIETQQPAVSFVDTANTNNYMHIAYDNGTVHHYNDANGDMIFSTNSANKFIVQGDQDVITCIRSYVVGTSRPSQSLRFQGHHAGFGDGVRTFSQIKSIKANTVGGSVAGMLTFYTNDTSNNLTERLKIDNEGGLTSNTNNNDWIYHGTNLHGSAPYGIRLSWSNASPDSSSYEWLYFVDSSAERFKVSSDGDIVADGQAINSDENLKENIVDATDKLADVMKLKVRNFDWKEEYHPNKVGEKKIGFIAQEVEKIFPSLVKEVDSPINSEREKGIKRKTIQDAFIPILVKAVQELSAKVEELEKN